MDEVAEAYNMQNNVLMLSDKYGSVQIAPQDVEDVPLQRRPLMHSSQNFDWPLESIDAKRLSAYDFKAYSSTFLSTLELIPGEEDFAVLLVLTSIAMSIGNGCTSVSNSFMYVKSITSESSFIKWLLTVYKHVCAVGMGLGLYLYGARVTKKVGSKFMPYNNSAAFSAQFAAAFIVMVCANIGYPVSTTQVFFSALLGISFFNSDPMVLKVNDKKALRDILLWWLFTIPACTLAPYIFSMIFNTVYEAAPNCCHADLVLSLIHICRCRRYAVCRSRWSPYP
eukprot:TRINITY_DN2079_c0_g2_i1.p1 TRINITY_DN2079_c0_g2~~TRINITY_DN2079_c0_g2_i1.p1  ORF type:complete len:281 (+),score=48.40 TRINITY_DN2079_c0_g2_i1:156-998(+)